MGSGGGGQSKDTTLLNTATASSAKAAEESPLERMIRENAEKWNNWRTGAAGPIDVRNAPDAAGMALADDARKTHDAGRIGKGYGTLSDNTNKFFSSALDKENQIDRDTTGAAGLENYITGRLDAADASMAGGASMANQRTQATANRDLDIWNAYVHRPQQPSFLKQLALGAANNIKGSVGAFTI